MTVSRQSVIKVLPRPKYKDELVIDFQTSKDIAKALRKAEHNSRAFSKKLVPFFKSSSAKKTCLKLWTFLRQEIIYEREPAKRQTAKEIHRFLYEGHGDCKHFATTAVGVLNACKIPAFFVLCSQNARKKNRPNHAYCIALAGDEVIVVDPCKKKFGDEARHIKKWIIAPRRKSNKNGTLLPRRRYEQT